jgi:hypothetical protein
MRCCRKSNTLRALLGAGLMMSGGHAWAQSPPTPVRPHAGLLRYPSVSAKQIVFVYANKL